MQEKYVIKDVNTWLYFDWYCADVYFTCLAQVSNCLYNSYEEAFETVDKYKSEISTRYIKIEKIIIMN